MAKQSWIDRARTEPAAAAALAIFVIAAATLAGAWYFQLVVGLPPCPLCLEERIPYHIIIPLALLLAIAALVRAPAKLLTVGFAVIAIAALCNAVLGAYHAGVEWHWWAGPTDCTGPLTNLRAGGSLLNSAAIDPCRALRRGGVAILRHFTRRLQRADLVGAGCDRGLRFVRTRSPASRETSKIPPCSTTPASTKLGRRADTATRYDAAVQCMEDNHGIVRCLKGALESEALPVVINTVLAQTQYQDLPGLVTALEKGGLGPQVQSWLGNGANMPITEDQLKTVLGNAQVQEFARHLGLPVDQTLSTLAKYLPEIVDKASPNGVLKPAA